MVKISHYEFYKENGIYGIDRSTANKIKLHLAQNVRPNRQVEFDISHH